MGDETTHTLSLVIQNGQLAGCIVKRGIPEQLSGWVNFLRTLTQIAHTGPLIQTPTLLTEQHHPTIETQPPAKFIKTTDLITQLKQTPQEHHIPEQLIILNPAEIWEKADEAIVTAAVLLPGIPHLDLAHRYILTQVNAQATPVNVTIADIEQNQSPPDEHAAVLLHLLDTY